MCFRVEPIAPIPPETQTIARSAFPKESVAMALRHELGTIYEDADFTDLFVSDQGQPAWSPWRLALITVMQYLEDLTDLQAAQAVRGRIDWKYALSLSLGDCGIDASVLSEFRTRLVSQHREEILLERLLERCLERGWLKSGGVQRSDSTYVVGAIRVLHRLEVIGETLRAALNSLAVAVPGWLQAQVPLEWYECYGSRLEEYHFPKGAKERQHLAETMGRDGHSLLAAVYGQDAPRWLNQLPAVEILRRVWVQQFYLDEHQQVYLRTTENSPPSAQLIHSPYDVEVRFSQKRETRWVGYKVHLTETCARDAPHLITHVETTAATTADVKVTQTLHQNLVSRQLSPQTHLVDAGYVDAGQLVASEAAYGIDLVGPVLPDSSWQAKAGQGFALSHFEIDWDNQQARCPQGHLSTTWKPSCDRHGNETLTVGFAYSTCMACVQHHLCTRATKQGRTLTLRPQAEHLALQQARQTQNTKDFQQRYARRAGIEGTLAQGIKAFGLRRCRYVGLAKTHLQHIITATAMNIVRLTNWWQGVPFAATRCSRFAALAPPASTFV